VNCEGCRADRMTVEAMVIFGAIHKRIDSERPRLLSLAGQLQGRADELCQELRDGGQCSGGASVFTMPIPAMASEKSLSLTVRDGVRQSVSG